MPMHTNGPAATHPDIPDGFAPLVAGGPFIQHNGPLYLLQQGGVVKFGFRVLAQHVNPMNNLHGGMMASFCDMLLPLSVHRKSEQVHNRFLPHHQPADRLPGPCCAGSLGRRRG